MSDSRDVTGREGQPPQPRRIIGLTGNIACGKSFVLTVLDELGADTVDADELVHRLLAPNGAAYAPVLDRFGATYLTATGEIDRRRLGRHVFANPDELHALERIVQPLVEAQVRELIAHARVPLVVDAIKLLEGGLAELCDEVWVVSCRPDQQLERLMARNGYMRDEALARIWSQPPQEEKLRHADVVIDNSGTQDETRRQVVAAWER